MAVIRMRRISRNEKAVRGSMRVNGRDIATLENADYIIPVGTYPVLVTFSPRFKRMLPLIGNVPGRSGILDFRLPEMSPEENAKAQILMGALKQGLTDLADAYPRNVTLTIQSLSH